MLELDTLSKSESQREQGKLMEVLVERVEYDPRDVAISVSFHRSGIKTLAAKPLTTVSMTDSRSSDLNRSSGTFKPSLTPRIAVPEIAVV